MSTDWTEVGLVIVMLLVVIGCCGGCYSSINLNMGSGAHDCTVYCVEQTGYPWQTYKVYVTYWGQNIHNEDVYTVDPADEELIATLNEAASNGQKVRINYREVMIPAPWTYGSDSIITKCINST